MAHLTSMPAELLHLIFQWLHPSDLLALPRVCRALHAFTKSNQKLCSDIYLHTLDTPTSDQKSLDWEHELRALLKLESLCLGGKRGNEGEDERTSRLSFVYETVNSLLAHASRSEPEDENHPVKRLPTLYFYSRNSEILAKFFQDDAAREAFMQRSFLFHRQSNDFRLSMSRMGDVPREEHQQSAKLHCLYGQPLLYTGRGKHSIYPFACSKVYDLRQYTQRTKWGPFMDDDTDRVDWEKVEAIFIVLGHNLVQMGADSVPSFLSSSPFSGSWSNSYRPNPDYEPSELEAKDPYGVTGSWYRIVCFLDYNDFFNFNFRHEDTIAANAPRPPLNVGEVARLILMNIHVTKIEAPGPDDGQALPVVHFEGISRGIGEDIHPDGTSEIRGTVRLTKEGEVRWTTFSIYHGEERWRSEGIQVGGVRSARGVLGNWFDRDYDIHGPAGPSAFWKADDFEKGFPATLIPVIDLEYSWIQHMLGSSDSESFTGSEEEDDSEEEEEEGSDEQRDENEEEDGDEDANEDNDVEANENDDGEGNSESSVLETHNNRHNEDGA